jgi:hypothetical protein
MDDLVLRRLLSREGMNKLSPCWEGPYRVTQVCRPGCIRLATAEGEPVPRPWNIEHLRKFYPWCSSEAAHSPVLRYCLEAVLGSAKLRWDLLPPAPE